MNTTNSIFPKCVFSISEADIPSSSPSTAAVEKGKDVVSLKQVSRRQMEACKVGARGAKCPVTCLARQCYQLRSAQLSTQSAEVQLMSSFETSGLKNDVEAIPVVVR